jgi:hypothetical protein
VGAHDRPFPPGGLPWKEAKLFKMAFDLAYKRDYLTEKYVIEGLGSQTAKRKLGLFQLEVEYQANHPLTLTRYVVMIWYEDHLVYHAWCARCVPSGELVGLVVTSEDGPWQAYLRGRSQREEKT